MWTTSIKSRVYAVIKERIKAAQVKHDERVADIEKEHEEAVKRMESNKTDAIEASATSLVENIIGKI